MAEPMSSLRWDEATKYKTLFDSIDAGFCVVRVLFDARDQALDYVFIEANPAFERQTGLTDALGRTMRSLAPDHESHWFEIYGEVARTGRGSRFEAEARALGRWYDVYAFSFGSPGEHLVGILFNDITRRKALERAVEERNEQLILASKRKDQFLAALSHELRNPLASLKVAAELLVHPRLSEERLAHTRGVIQRQVGLMTSMVDDLLDVARITQDKLDLKLDRIRHRSVIETAIETVKPLIDRKRHTLEMDLEASDPWLNVDPIRLAQVVANLLANAAKYTHPGGRIILRSRVERERLSIQVVDTGIGLEASAKSRIFEMFSQDARATGQAEGGLGVGLYLVQKLVTLHGGEVKAESDGPGCGSTFSVSLPVST